MDYLPIFEPKRVHRLGGTEVREEPHLLAGKAFLMTKPGDGVVFHARGRHLGLVFVEHQWSGVIEIRMLHKTYQVDLYSPVQRSRVFELALPSVTVPVPVLIRLLPRHHRDAQSTQAWLTGAYIADCAAGDLPGRLLECVEEEPHTVARLNQLTDVFKWYDADWMAALDELAATPAYTPPNFVHRKSWEWVQTVYGLQRLGMVRPDAKALGVGVGWEPLSFFFANRVAEVVATDLYPVESEWTGREGSPKILENPKDFAPYDYPEDRVRFLRMDGTKLDFPAESFDFVWSCSSIEHFGRHEGARRSMQEMERVLRPGGVASVITEYVLPHAQTGELTTFDPEYFNLRCVYDYLVRPVPSLKLVQPLDLNLPDYYRQRPVLLPEESEAPHGGIDKPHVVLRVPTGTEITSIALFLRKAGRR